MSKYISAEDNHMKYDNGAIVVSGTVYADGNPCILIKGAKDDAPVAKATVNIPHITDMPIHKEGDQAVLIKDYSENEGVLETLIDADIVIPLMPLPLEMGTVLFVQVTDESIVQEIREASEERNAA
jgi:hypothetical protein